VKVFPLTLLPRQCPRCGEHTIIGHGQRRRQSHDEFHDWIWVRRGLCRLCKVTFTILPNWASPSSHYSFRCREQAWRLGCTSGAGWEHSTPTLKDPDRLPDPATLHRWAQRTLVSLFFHWKSRWLHGLDTVLNAPTILAWDCPAAARILLLEANSP